MHADRLNLASPNSTTQPIEVPDGVAAQLTIDINDKDATKTWGSAVVNLQFSTSVEADKDGVDLTHWQNFSPTVQFTSSTKARRAVGVTGAGNVRLIVSTTDSGADPAAVVTLRSSWR